MTVGISRETYEHVVKNLHLLELDLVGGKILNRKSKRPDSDGYLRVTFNRRTVKQHIVFAVARWGDKCIGLTVNHINEDKTDNSRDNLELMPIAKNISIRSSPHGRPKQVIKVIDLSSGEERIFPSQLEAARSVGVSQGRISELINKYGGYHRLRNIKFERVIEGEVLT